jgi:SAM-dependent methyltransferase
MARIVVEPVLPVLYRTVRATLKSLVDETGGRCALLDVGGRKSPYTVGLDASVTIIDLPREGEVRTRLNLGLTERLLGEIRRRRSNIESVVLEDMTRCSLPSASFDGAVSVEVIEHVPDDAAFVAQIARVLKPGGWLVMTTPNGDFVRNDPPNHNPDHVRHYRRSELRAVLEPHFEHVEVSYGIKTGRHRSRGLRSFEPTRPVRTAAAMLGNVVNGLESRGLAEQANGTANLLVLARKAR